MKERMMTVGELSDFCNMQMQRLHEHIGRMLSVCDVVTLPYGVPYFIAGYKVGQNEGCGKTQLMADIRRLRRDLLDLEKELR